MLCKHAVKKLPFVIKHVPDCYETKDMCDRAIPENSGMLGFTPDCYKEKNV